MAIWFWFIISAVLGILFGMLITFLFRKLSVSGNFSVVVPEKVVRFGKPDSAAKIRNFSVTDNNSFLKKS